MSTEKNNTAEYVFFLGGYDAEMCTIQEILQKYKIRFYDKALSWGTPRSLYKPEIDTLTDSQTAVFVELIPDYPIPSNAIIIDHHNESSGKDKPSSLEQVADLLHIELTRYQKVICANDKGYFTGLKVINATEEEIVKVRMDDKRCQGVTQIDEDNGELSIKHFLTQLSDDTVLINSLTNKTCIITDRIHHMYRHIFIVTPSGELNYSGTGQMVEKLKQKYSEVKASKPAVKTWWGGYLPGSGYFGASEPLTKGEIMDLCDIKEEKRMFSQHIFMFPFTIESANKENGVFKLIKLYELHQIITNPEISDWKYQPFKIALDIQDDVRQTFSPDEVWAYNEYMYFYEYVREALFNNKETVCTDKLNSFQVSSYYELDTLRNDEMIIDIQSKNGIRKLALTVNHISMRLFETGIGILCQLLYIITVILI